MRPFQGKADLLAKLHSRLRAYASWLPNDWRVVVIVDRDDEDCAALKGKLESAARAAGLVTRSRARGPRWQLVNRIVVEELEAWYFGDWTAVRGAYPRVAATITNQAGYRDPDAIHGGTWEAFERVMRRNGYFRGGLRKIEAVGAIGALLDPTRCASSSFATFRDAILEATA